ncbi:hypothetical protein OIU74_003855 [Salix koriyanagi]|uniref:Uncharacterized protein n=1 Tax=Salix koriyanagi TaxID=2511006 RepID=A0A9Q0ZLJ4_9ROSI|nr:hypothetical protein OIU74_003855 [Salix koriyanagi]
MEWTSFFLNWHKTVCSENDGRLYSNMSQEPFWPTTNFANKVPPFLVELSEEEEILAMMFGEGFPDLPRLFGLAAKDMGISNGSMDSVEEIRVRDFRADIEANQFFIIGTEPITMR